MGEGVGVEIWVGVAGEDERGGRMASSGGRVPRGKCAWGEVGLTKGSGEVSSRVALRYEPLLIQ